MLKGLSVENYRVKNQFLIRLEGKLILQSYSSIVAVVDKDNKIILGRDWDYSTTTSKYVYMFLNTFLDSLAQVCSKYVLNCCSSI